MIVLCRQKVKVRDAKLGILELNNNELANVDDRWLEVPFVNDLLKSGMLIAHSSDNTTKLEEEVKNAEIKQVIAEDKKELDILINEAKKKATTEAKKIAKEQGFDKVRQETLINEMVEKAVKEATDSYNEMHPENKASDPQ